MLLLDIPPLFITALFALFSTVLALTVFWIKRQQEMRRTAERADLARDMGLPFQEKDDYGMLQLLKNFDLFHRERWKLARQGKVTNVMQGQVGDTKVYMFDYTYIVSNGKSSRRVRQTVFFADDKNWALPNFHLRPENWWYKVMAYFGKTDINFPENPDFSERFWLTGEVQQMIREIFTPEVQAFLTEHQPKHLEGNNYYLIAYKRNKVLRGEEARAFFEHCCKLTELLQKQDRRGEILDLAEVQIPAPLEAPAEKSQTR